MADRQEWDLRGLQPRQLVRCVVTGHRGRFGIDVQIVAPRVPQPRAFIDFVLLVEPGEQIDPSGFPPVGSSIAAVTVDIMPDGELRLDATPSAVLSLRPAGEE